MAFCSSGSLRAGLHTQNTTFRHSLFLQIRARVSVFAITMILKVLRTAPADVIERLQDQVRLLLDKAPHKKNVRGSGFQPGIFG